MHPIPDNVIALTRLEPDGTRTIPAPPPERADPAPPGSFDPRSLTPKERHRRERAAERSDYRGYLRDLSMAALLDLAEGLAWSGDGLDWDHERPGITRLESGRYLAMAQDELARRQRMVRAGRAPTAYRAHSDRLTRLSRAIHDGVHLGHVAEDLGIRLLKRGAEFHCECARCGGRDRFVIWPPPRSRGWCRRCGWTVDVIAFWRFWEGCGFADAVMALASRYLGVGEAAQ